MKENLQNQLMDDICLSPEINELSPFYTYLDSIGGSNAHECITIAEFLIKSNLSFGNELESFESLVGGMNQSSLLHGIFNLDISACSAGCAGTCSGNCSSSCADSCYNRCKSTYNS